MDTKKILEDLYGDLKTEGELLPAGRKFLDAIPEDLSLDKFADFVEECIEAPSRKKFIELLSTQHDLEEGAEDVSSLISFILMENLETRQEILVQLLNYLHILKTREEHNIGAFL